MSLNAPLFRYTLIAFVIVVVLAGLAAVNRGLFFNLLDPVGSLERRQERALHALGSADVELSSQQAHELFQRFVGGEDAAASALLQQDRKHGLPEEFIRHLETLLTGRSRVAFKARYLVQRMALHRPFNEAVESALADSVHSPEGGTDTQPIIALGNIGSQRPLAAATLHLLLEVALAHTPAERTALGALEKTARANGLPEWALDRLEEIADKRPGPIRSDAIRVMAAADAGTRALTIINTPGAPAVNREAIAIVLNAEDPATLDRLLRDSGFLPEVRSGALRELVKHRDLPERVGPAVAYALEHSEAALRVTAFSTYAQWGRHHSRYIDVAWPDVCARAFADENVSIRTQVARTFRFIPFSDRNARDRFLLQMLNGSTAQKRTALQAVAGMPTVTDAVKHAVLGLADSDDYRLAEPARMLKERYRPRGRLEGLGSWLAGAVFWTLLVLPALTAVGFETYFVARVLQSFSDGGAWLRTLLVSVVWFALSVALGLLLFVAVLGLGHGGGSGVEIYVVLLVVNLVFAGIAMFLSVFVRRRSAADL